MSGAGARDKKPPKPRPPARVSSKPARKGRAATKPAAKTGATGGALEQRVDQIAAAVARLEAALAPGVRSSDVAAEEHALLNLVDAIVDRRTEALLVPLARVAGALDRVAASHDPAAAPPLLAEAAALLEHALVAVGLERIAPGRGEPFSPLLHEEVEQTADPRVPDGHVLGLVRPGYRVRGGRVLVPALVAVSTGTGP